MPDQVVEFHLAWPDPYRGYLNQVLHADLLVSKGTWTTRASSLVTVHYLGRQAPPLTYAVAASLPNRASGVALVEAGDGLHWCNSPSHRCRINFGWDHSR